MEKIKTKSPKKGKKLKEKKEKVGIDDFSMLCTIGEGSYATVILVKKKDTKKLFALKIMKKKHIKKKKQKKHIKEERNVLTEINFPFVVKLAYAF